MCCSLAGKALLSRHIRQYTGTIMDSWTLNKVLGATLATALAVFGLKELGGVIYHAEPPIQYSAATDKAPEKKPAFFIEVAEAETAGGGEAAVEETIAVRLAKADVASGQTVAKACISCHSFESGGANKTGPNLYDVIERPKASVAGFGYSEAAKAQSAEKWDYDKIDAFLTNPKAYTKGTAMNYGGVKNAQKRADLVAYLASLSASPKPFPAP
jgi:cytochrome c